MSKTQSGCGIHIWYVDFVFCTIQRLTSGLGGGARILRIPSLRLRGLPGQMVRQAEEDGLSRSDDVSSGAADERLDREGH